MWLNCITNNYLWICLFKATAFRMKGMHAVMCTFLMSLLTYFGQKKSMIKKVKNKLGLQTYTRYTFTGGGWGLGCVAGEIKNKAISASN